MGEIADDIIAGRCCGLCGQYFVSQPVEEKYAWEESSAQIFEHGYPVACDDCWEPGCGYEKATASTL